MKTLTEYMAMSYRMEIVEDKDEGGFVVSYPELPGCITCGETIERAVENAADAKKAWLEAALEEGIEIHEPGSLEEYSREIQAQGRPRRHAPVRNPPHGAYPPRRGRRGGEGLRRRNPRMRSRPDGPGR